MTAPGVPRFHLIGPSDVVDEDRYVAIAADAIDGGVTAVHVRMPGAPAGTVLACLRGLRARKGNARIIVNDRVDVAIVGDAHGVHLGERGLSVGDTRRLIGKKRLIGRSIHDERGARDAEQAGADFIVAGHIFPTASKPDQSPRGVEWLRMIVDATTLPVIAIGGIDSTNLEDALVTGAYGIAVSSAILRAQSPGAVAREMCAILGNDSQRS